MMLYTQSAIAGEGKIDLAKTLREALPAFAKASAGKPVKGRLAGVIAEGPSPGASGEQIKNVLIGLHRMTKR